MLGGGLTAGVTSVGLSSGLGVVVVVVGSDIVLWERIVRRGSHKGGWLEKYLHVWVLKKGGLPQMRQVEENKEETTAWTGGRGRLEWMSEREVVRGQNPLNSLIYTVHKRRPQNPD